MNRTEKGIFPCQQRYAENLLERFGMAKCKAISSPIEVNARLGVEEGGDLNDPSLYRQLVGSLIYLTLSWSDIAHAVGIASRYM